MKAEFINKWKNWWILQKQAVALTDAFAKELDDVIAHEAARGYKRDVEDNKSVACFFEGECAIRKYIHKNPINCIGCKYCTKSANE